MIGWSDASSCSDVPSRNYSASLYTNSVPAHIVDTDDDDDYGQYLIFRLGYHRRKLINACLCWKDARRCNFSSSSLLRDVKLIKPPKRRLNYDYFLSMNRKSEQVIHHFFFPRQPLFSC